jgi:predicted adenylyl cyclase CyaB
MQNIEIKTPAPDREAVLRALEALGAAAVWIRRQRDIFFHVPAGYLKLRRVEGEPGELIAYTREPGTEPRPSDYEIATVADPEAVESALTRALGVLGVVEKTRRLYTWRHTRIHLDTVSGLGEFLELEAVAREISLEEARGEAETVISCLGLDRGAFLDRPYLELLLEGRRGSEGGGG